jgi:hypothetical protein
MGGAVAQSFLYKEKELTAQAHLQHQWYICIFLRPSDYDWRANARRHKHHAFRPPSKMSSNSACACGARIYWSKARVLTPTGSNLKGKERERSIRKYSVSSLFSAESARPISILFVTA